MHFVTSKLAQFDDQSYLAKNNYYTDKSFRASNFLVYKRLYW